MEAVSYTSIRGTYAKVPCTLADIPNDLVTIQLALKAVGEVLEDVVEYTANMEESIAQGLAYAINHNGVRIGFMYLRFDELFPGKLVASSLSIPKDILALLILLLAVNLSKYIAIIMYPHGRNMLQFKSLITGKSLRLYNSGKINYVVIAHNQHRPRTFINMVKVFKLKKVR